MKSGEEAARLLVVSSSIRSQSPPAPDILCEIQGRGPVAFYCKIHPIELLAYCISQPPSDSFDWQSEFHSYVREALSRCPFERVWVFDNWSTEKIKYVYPPLDEGIEK
jgi:hypothetical protein